MSDVRELNSSWSEREQKKKESTDRTAAASLPRTEGERRRDEEKVTFIARSIYE